MSRTAVAAFIPLALILALAGCGKGANKTTGGTADGEILPGSASDAMLPLDSLRSQPPLAPQGEGGAKTAAPGKTEKPGKSVVSEAPAGDAPAVPAKEPAAPAAPAPEAS